ncbi:hypothetical protein JAAARDRAFT_191829 [Jaapia argillacea MUCL 33604]|uniref:Uncharacterized protein n=1 Tax=Jaapia argillacea MUCL 33604 TaxID=933084 RepID=A0A067Q2V0_9AGAM|nr:hypothetical protein JAAARDRAFT_191829 [Jaapia argillacea MUCL 33604]
MLTSNSSQIESKTAKRPDGKQVHKSRLVRFSLPLPCAGRRARLYSKCGIPPKKPGELHHNSILAAHAISVIKHRTGYRGLSVECAAIDEDAPQEAIPPGRNYVPVLTICSNEYNSYYSRPTQEQVDHLTGIF